MKPNEEEIGAFMAYLDENGATVFLNAIKYQKAYEVAKMLVEAFHKSEKANQRQKYAEAIHALYVVFSEVTFYD